MSQRGLGLHPFAASSTRAQRVYRRTVEIFQLASPKQVSLNHKSLGNRKEEGLFRSVKGGAAEAMET